MLEVHNRIVFWFCVLFAINLTFKKWFLLEKVHSKVHLSSGPTKVTSKDVKLGWIGLYSISPNSH